jgi:predicted acyl esterase
MVREHELRGRRSYRGARSGGKVEHDVPAKMRDGIILRSDLLSPERSGEFPSSCADISRR